MENREQQILSEIKEMMASIRAQLELLDVKMAQLQQCVDPEDFDADPIELDIDMVDDLPEAVVEPVQEKLLETLAEPQSPEIDTPLEETPLEETPIEETPIEETLIEDTQNEDLPLAQEEVNADAQEEENAVAQEEDDDLPGVFDMPSTVHSAVQASSPVKQSVVEAMADKQAWRSDMPGSPVKDVRSAISLNDRIIFINHLFNEDPMAFQDAIAKVNSVSSLDEVVEYVMAEYPQWDLGSELVYRFMMAVRRRVK